MKPLDEILKEIFDEAELKYQHDEERSLFSIRLKAENTDVTLILKYDDTQQMIYCYSDFPVKIPKVKYISVLRAINVINYKYSHATFALDEADGQLLARACMNTDDGAINSKVVFALIQGCVNIIDFYLKELMSLIFKGDDEVFTEEIISNQKVINGLN